MEEQFGGKSVPWLTEYLTKIGIQESDKGRSERKAEVVELVVKASEMNISDVIAGKLRTENGTIPHPKNIQNWSFDIYKMPPFSFADLYMYLIGSEEYTAENVKSFKESAWVQVIFRWSS